MRNSPGFDLNFWTFPDCLVPVESKLVLAAMVVLGLMGTSELCALPLLGLLMEGIVCCETGLCLLQIDRSVTEMGTERQQSLLMCGVPSAQFLLASVAAI